MAEVPRVPETVEICVVGAGSAALATAIAAREAGAEVLLLEKAPKAHVGGSLRYCGGLRAVNPEYSEEKFYSDIMMVTQGRADPELTRIMVHESSHMIEWLKSFGVQFSQTMERGAFLIPEGGCYRVLKHLLSAAKQKGVTILYETKAYTLLTDDFGRVIGVKVKKKGNPFSEIRCGAVVLACGGYSANPEMMCKYYDRYAGTMLVRGSRYNTGEGIVMAEKVGAKISFMGDFHGTAEHRDAPRTDGGGCTVRPYRMGLWINLNGKRFIDEGETYEDKTYVKLGKAIYAQPGNIAFLIFDEKIKNKTFRDANDRIVGGLKRTVGSNIDVEMQPVYAKKRALADVFYEAQSLEELAQAIGVPPVTLRGTIDEYNTAITETGGVEDTPYAPHLSPPKMGWAYPIADPPYYAYPAVCGITFTFGGAVINKNSEVLDKEGAIIPGLYAVGALTAGFFYYNYASGSGLTRNITFGRIAGKNAATYIHHHRGL